MNCLASLPDHFLYTDGSTETKKRKSKNSGYGIYITTSSCGIVRSDGNNFVAEMAAASIVIKALPQNRTMTMHIDSQAAIQALTQGTVSERKRIKMQGRAWKSFIKTTMAKRRPNQHSVCKIAQWSRKARTTRK